MGIKYTGRDIELTMGSTAVPCSNIRAITVSEKIDLVDSTGACDEFMEYISMRRDVDVTIEVLDSTTPSEVYGLFTPSRDGQNLVVYPLGNSSGKPKLTCTDFRISGRDRGLNYNDVVAVSVSGKASGGFAETTV